MRRREDNAGRGSASRRPPNDKPPKGKSEDKPEDKPPEGGFFDIIEFISFGVEAGLPPYFCFW
jgi:hypothetical protein